MEKKSNAGRKPKIKEINLKQVEVLGELGLTDVEMAKALGIAKSTLNNYKSKYPEFMDSLKRGKEVADERVVRSLFQRALGYSHPEVHISNYQGVITITPIIKHYPPDPVSMIFWLKNRRPEQWRDKPIADDPDEDENKLTF